MKLKQICIILPLIAIFSLSCGKETGQKTQSTISVLGTGTVFTQPDMVQLSITLSNVNRTTKLAQEEVSRMARQVMTILRESGIEEKNISTASLSFRTEYEYRSGVRVLIGQRAEQRLTFTIEDIANDSEKVPAVIDRLIEINGIELNQISFGIKNNTEYFVRSRELAFQKALEKAEQYAALAGLEIIKVLSISEEGAQQMSPVNNRMTNQLYQVEALASGDYSTVLPAGESEVTTRILVVFLLE